MPRGTWTIEVVRPFGEGPVEGEADEHSVLVPKVVKRKEPTATSLSAPEESISAERTFSNAAFSTTSVSAGWIQYCPRAISATPRPKLMAWIRGWISVEACSPMRCAPINRPVAGSAISLQRLVVSSIAQPYAVLP